MTSERGLYIVGEGADFVGKTTQKELLQEYWKDRNDIVYVREPGGTSVAERLREIILLGEEVDAVTEILMFTAARSHLWRSVIEPALEEGKTVFSDRSWYSTLAYQGVHNLEMIRIVEEQTRLVMPERYVHPDKAYVITLSPEERIRRKVARLGVAGKGDNFERRDNEFFIGVSEIYNNVVIGRLGAKAIDGIQKPLSIHSDIVKYLEAA